jgi:hypothetical protein
VWLFGTRVLQKARRNSTNILVISVIQVGTELANDDGLRLFGITRSGLLAMMISVFTLWSAIVLERAALDRAERDARAAVRTLERLKEQSVPASEPTPPFRSPSVKSS